MALTFAQFAANKQLVSKYTAPALPTPMLPHVSGQSFPGPFFSGSGRTTTGATHAVSGGRQLASRGGMMPPVSLGSLASGAVSAFSTGGLGQQALGVASSLGIGGQSQILSVGRKYILRKTKTGRIVATPRVPRRRFSTRARGSKMEKLLEYALIAQMLHK